MTKKLLCKLLGHKWQYCVCLRCRETCHEWQDGCTCHKCEEVNYFKHKWNGCTCKICKFVKDEGHNWEHCVCKICGAKRDAKHNWNGCKCAKCGKTRDEKHLRTDPCADHCPVCGKYVTPKHVFSGCICDKCGYTESIYGDRHVWDGCLCPKCGTVKPLDDPGHNLQGCTCSICKQEIHDFEVVSSNVEIEYTSTVGINRAKVTDYERGVVTKRCKRCGFTEQAAYEYWTDN